MVNKAKTITKNPNKIKGKIIKPERTGQKRVLHRSQRKASSYVKKNFGDVIKKLSGQ